MVKSNQKYGVGLVWGIFQKQPIFWCLNFDAQSVIILHLKRMDEADELFYCKGVDGGSLLNAQKVLQ